MKRIIAIIAALALSVSLASCGSSNQANAIKAACDLAIAKDFDGTSAAFSIIASNNPGYIAAASGARIWAKYKGEPDYWAIKGEIDSWGEIRAFYALCNRVQVTAY
jgi:hypothetical protein